MAETFALIEENTQRSINLVYDASTNPNRKTIEQYIRSFESQVLYHRPVSGPPVPVRLTDEPIEAYFRLISPGQGGSSWDTPQDVVTQLKRWVDGADQQAFKAYTYGEGNKIKLKGALNGQTDYAYFDVMWGYVDDSEAYYNGPADRNYQAHPVMVYLRMAPAGIGDPIVLRNDLPSSPHFIEDSNGDGLADGWEIDSDNTATLNTSFYVMGGQSQKIVTAGTPGYLTSGKMLVTAGEGLMFQYWVYSSAGTAPAVNIASGQGGTTYDTGTTNDSTFTDLHGNSWSRYTGFAVPPADCVLDFSSASGATYYVDGCRVHLLTGYLDNCGFTTAGAGGADVFGSWGENAGTGAIATSATAKTGSAACKLTAGASANTYVYQDFTSIPGRSYTLRFYTRSTTGDAASRYYIYDITNQKSIVDYTSSGVTGETYTEVTKSFVAPPNCTTIRIHLYCSPTNTDIVYFDDVIVHPTGIQNGWISTSTIFNRCDTGRELLSNTGFETAGGGGADIWANWSESAGDGALANSATAQAGSDAAQLTTGATANTVVYQSVTVVPGRSYMLDFYCRSTTGDGAPRYYIYDVTNAAAIVAMSSTGITGETYTLFQKRFTAPAACVEARIALACSATNTDVVYFDECHIYDEAAINYVDTWGLPGDMDALASILIQENPQLGIASTPNTFIGGRANDGYYQVANIPHWLDSTDSSMSVYEDGAGAWAVTTDTTRSNNSYQRFTAAGDESVIYFRHNLSAASDQRLMHSPYRIYAICRTSDSSNITITPAAAYFGEVSTDARQLTNDNIWEIIDLGLYNAKDTYPYKPIGSAPAVELIQFNIGGSGAADTFDFDALLYVPVNEIGVFLFTSSLATYDWFLNALDKTLDCEQYGTPYSPPMGSLYYLAPGTTSTRTYFVFTDFWGGVDSVAHTLTDTVKLLVTAYPRTRHLLNPGATIP